MNICVSITNIKTKDDIFFNYQTSVGNNGKTARLNNQKVLSNPISVEKNLGHTKNRSRRRGGDRRIIGEGRQRACF